MISLPIFLGWLCVVLLFLTVFLFLIKKLNKHLFKGKSKSLQNFIKLSRNWHIYTATMLIIVGMVHGYVALNRVFTFNSGHVLFLSIMIVALLGVFFHNVKNKKILLFHKLLALLVVFFLIWHILSVL